MRSVELDNPDALKWGKMLSADFVILGKSVFLDDNNIVIKLKVISVKDGLVLGEDSETGHIDLNEGTSEGKGGLFERVLRKLADRLIPSILSLGSGATPSIQRFKVTLKGLKSFKEFRILQEFLKKDVPGMKSVHQSRIGQGFLTMDIEFAGSKEQLLAKLLNQEKLPVKLVLQDATETEIVLSVSE